MGGEKGHPANQLTSPSTVGDGAGHGHARALQVPSAVLPVVVVNAVDARQKLTVRTLVVDRVVPVVDPSFRGTQGQQQQGHDGH